ncbi:transglycosylase domain-containing protein [Fructilactobacillus lindneri]|uniref:Penicillin-binding protein n=1 Tax=Fructilactobacillus lindneri TaxID=53444 RepID=A0AB33BD72_9LACO|nr:PBP1A family penicillin-binding protein [Fructilactobacillus lindneri]ANZ58289.1 penicillin-binding protein [Fructilactobacillus lindneri]ANZ59611.1 penicillin-binding protein [Fructilactobacillus lindneri]POG98605.1 penicillin-binding protein [Fructilactobacillus lindneri]POH03993.1 penicillin-binding protein [Fructilactobacillus lindneri]POH04765.1 penicillin-binding protein [Fructilactobacillus lindneri]
MAKYKDNSFFKTFFKRIWYFIYKYWKKFQITKWIVVIVLFFSLIFTIYLTIIAKTSHVHNLQSNLSRSTLIYDKNGTKAGGLYSQKGTYVSSQKISPNIPNAILSTEDRNFYHEHGFSVKGYGRAILLAIGNKIMGRNQISGGGSTISQQLAKNTFLSQQQTLSRKFKELFISIEIENLYSKKQIITMYMNNAYFGNGVYGVQDASRKYFGMDAKNLPVQDAAVLAGMLQNPSNNPIDHPEAAKQRRNVVLELMAENGKISKSELKNYQKLPLGTKDTFKVKDGYKYPYYFDAVINEAISKYGLTEKQIMNDGYKIYTNLDQQQQSSFQKDFKNPELFPQNAADGTKVQAASVAVNPKNGGVQAVVGGRNKDIFRGFNRATDIKRQPGSTMKPLAVYTPALENGFNYDSKLVNKKLSYGKNNYTPNNYNNQYSGKVPMYEALAQSMNAPAVWTLNKIGVNKGYESVQKFGLPVTKKDDNLALALGGLSSGVSPQQMAGAYTAFANHGQVSKPFYITKIVDSTGKTVGKHESSPSQIMSDDTAKQMTSMMMGVFDYGTGATAKPSGYQIAGKTGSTEADNSKDADATRDKWLVGYTPDVVVATWEGFDNTNSSHHLENLSGTGVNTLYKQQMEQIIPYTKQTPFKTQDAATLVKEKDKQNKHSSSKDKNDLAGKVQDFSKNVEVGAKSVAHNLIDGARSLLGR